MLNRVKLQHTEDGDTLIEVLFAMTVFALVVVTSLTLMNQGITTAQRSLEITSVRQQMDGQIAALNFLHDSYVQGYSSGKEYDTTDTVSSPAEEYWKIIKSAEASNRSSASAFGATAECKVPDNPGKDFIINPVTAKFLKSGTGGFDFAKAPTSAQLVYGSGSQLVSSQGMWIEAVRSTASGGTGYIDFHVRACWDALGLSYPMNLGTIVRLYEPRG